MCYILTLLQSVDLTQWVIFVMASVLFIYFLFRNNAKFNKRIDKEQVDDGQGLAAIDEFEQYAEDSDSPIEPTEDDDGTDVDANITEKDYAEFFNDGGEPHMQLEFDTENGNEEERVKLVMEEETEETEVKVMEGKNDDDDDDDDDDAKDDELSGFRKLNPMQSVERMRLKRSSDSSLAPPDGDLVKQKRSFSAESEV